MEYFTLPELKRCLRAYDLHLVPLGSERMIRCEASYHLHAILFGSSTNSSLHSGTGNGREANRVLNCSWQRHCRLFSRWSLFLALYPSLCQWSLLAVLCPQPLRDCVVSY